MRSLQFLRNLDYPQVINFLLVIVILGNLILLPIYITLDFDITGVESNVVFTLQNILVDNASLYGNPEQFPFAVTQYAPFYYILADGLISLLGIEAGDDLIIRIVGRFLSLMLTCGVVYMIYITSRKLIGAHKKASITLGLALAAFTVPWYFLTRPDVLVALSYILFINVGFRYIDQKKWTLAFWMGTLGILAFVSKQNGIFLIGAGGLFFLYNRNFKGLFHAFLGFVAAAFIFTVLAIWLGYDFQYFYQNAFEGVNNGIGIRSFLDETVLAYFSVFGFYSIGTLYITSKLLRKDEVDDKLFFLFWFAVLLLGFATLTALKKGSAINYYNEFLMVTLLIWAFYCNKYDTYSAMRRMQRAALFITLSALFVTIIHMRMYLFVNFKQWSTNDIELQKLRQLVDEELGSEYIYSEVRQLSLRFPGRVVLPQYDIAECCAYPKDVYNYAELCELIENGKLKFLIFDNPAPQSLYGCDISNNFGAYGEFGRYRIYKNLSALTNN